MTKILLILFELGFLVNFNLVGSISLSELFLLITSFYYIRKTNFKNKEIRTITKLYIFLFIAQIFSECIVGNDINNALKGFAITIVSYLHVIFLYYYLRKNSNFIIYAIVGVICCRALAGDLTDGESIGSVGSSQFVYILKFYIASIILNSMVVFSIIKRKWNIELIAVLVGVTLIGLGARSSGLMVFLTGSIHILIKYKKKLGIKSFTPIIIASSLLFYFGYVFYVNQVLDGKIKSGNSDQLLRLENPYNPVNLLITGRTEAFVGYVAFMDRPLTGWGAWAKDPNWKYHILASYMGGRDGSNSGSADTMSDIIPSHSVIIGYAMQNGVFAFIAILSIVFFIIKMALYSIRKNDYYNYTLMYSLIVLCWNGLFSPLSHFRLLLPLYMTFILVRYQVNKYKKLPNGNSIENYEKDLLCNNR